MLQIEIFENRNRSLLLCGGFPVCQRYTRRQKSLLYSFPLSPSSSGQGRHPFKVDIAGSNPAGGTTESEKPVTNSVTGFFLPQRRDSNPTGCGAEETRKRFPAQHARSEATQQMRAAPAARGHPAGGTTESGQPVINSVAGFLLPICRDSNPAGCGSRHHRKARGQKIANMITVTNLVTAISCHLKAI